MVYDAGQMKDKKRPRDAAIAACDTDYGIMEDKYIDI